MELERGIQALRQHSCSAELREYLHVDCNGSWLEPNVSCWYTWSWISSCNAELGGPKEMYLHLVGTFGSKSLHGAFYLLDCKDAAFLEVVNEEPFVCKCSLGTNEPFA